MFKTSMQIVFKAVRQPISNSFSPSTMQKLFYNTSKAEKLRRDHKDVHTYRLAQGMLEYYEMEMNKMAKNMSLLNDRQLTQFPKVFEELKKAQDAMREAKDYADQRSKEDPEFAKILEEKSKKTSFQEYLEYRVGAMTVCYYLSVID